MEDRNRNRRRAATIAVAVASLAGVAVARDLGSRDARKAIAALLGRDPDAIRIKSVTPGPLGNDATVTAQMDVAFQLTRAGDDWRVTSVRLADGRWEEVEMLRRALDAEKRQRAEADLRALAAGIDAYRRERGFYPEVETVAALVDAITPRFLPTVVRVDPWTNPYTYEIGKDGIQLASPGPDGEAGTGDDVLLAVPMGAPAP